MATATSLLLAVMPALVIAGGLHDLLTMKIPNRISGVLVIAFGVAGMARADPLAGLHAVIDVCLQAWR